MYTSVARIILIQVGVFTVTNSNILKKHITEKAQKNAKNQN